MIDIEKILNSSEKTLRKAITTYFREAIGSGELEPGSSIPSSRELATQLNTSYPNVHKALVPLVKEGLITRCRKLGTTVAKRDNNLTAIAVYMFHYKLDDIPQFTRTLIDIIGSRLKEQGIELRIIIDSVNYHGLDQIKKWAETREIQGVILPSGAGTKNTADIIEKLPVPFTSLSPVNKRSGAVKMDNSQLISLAVESLKRQGCQKIGVVSTYEHFYTDEYGMVQENQFYLDLKSKAAEHGLEIKPEWIESVSSANAYIKTSEESIKFGYESCDRILSMDKEKQPDGLFIFPDRIITGVMLALMKHQSASTKPVKLVLHRNWEIDAQILVPCDMIGVSIEEIADILISNISMKFEGKNPKTELVKYELRTNK